MEVKNKKNAFACLKKINKKKKTNGKAIAMMGYKKWEKS